MVKTSREGNQQARTDRTIANNKPVIIIRDNKKRNVHVNRCCNSWRQKCDQERSCEDFKIKRPHNRNSAHVECESNSDTSNNRDDWNHFKIIQRIPE